MLPNNNYNTKIKILKKPSLTYKLNLYRKKIIDNINNYEALQQAIFKILNTERYSYLIYSWNYGIELFDLIGMPIPFVMSEVKIRIKEALLQDDRILDVHSFSFEQNNKELHITFFVKTIYGEIHTKKVVKI